MVVTVVVEAAHLSVTGDAGQILRSLTALLAALGCTHESTPGCPDGFRTMDVKYAAANAHNQNHTGR